MLRCIRAFVVIETNNASLCCQKQTTLLESLLKRISILTIQSISVQSKSSWHFKKQERVSQAYEMSVSKKRVHTKRTTLHFSVRNGERFPLQLETNNAFRIVTQTYVNSEHMIDFFVVKVFMVLLDRYHCWKRTAFPFVVRNEQRFKNLHGVVGNKERFSDKNFSTLLPIYSLKF